MKLFLGIAAVLSWLVGIMMLFAPALFYAPMGMTLTPILGTIAQAHGATLIGLGTIDWLARRAEGPGLVAVLGGNVVVQFLSFIVVVRTAMLGAGAATAPAWVIHVGLGLGFVFFLLRARRSSSLLTA